MPGRPYLLDNLSDSGRHADALSYLLEDIDAHHGLSVATGYVNLGGLRHVALAVAGDRRVRLLIGATPAPGLGAQLPDSLFERILKRHHGVIYADGVGTGKTTTDTGSSCGTSITW